MNAAKNVMSAPFSISGKQTGASSTVRKFDRKVYVVICSSEPPSFCVTTAAAVAQGDMQHISSASISTFADADGTATYAPGDNSAPIVGGCVNRTLKGISSSKLVIRTSTYAKFAANKLPYDDVNKKPRVVNITGIATRYNDTWQILIRKESDVVVVEN